MHTPHLGSFPQSPHVEPLPQSSHLESPFAWSTGRSTCAAGPTKSRAAVVGRAARAGRAGSRGLTLVELVIVITIIGVLTAAISIGVLQAQKRANAGAAKTACSTIRSATMQWKAVNPGADCPTVAQLKTERDLDTGFSLKDPWGNLYQLTCDTDEIWCTSAGPDKKEGTDDDIKVPQVDPNEGK